MKKVISIILVLIMCTAVVSESASIMAAETNTLTTGRTVKCDKCGGSGRLLCSLCNGLGSYLLYDVVSQGNKRYFCTRCGGTGRVECDECHGAGTWTVSDSDNSKSNSSSSSSSSNNKAKKKNTSKKTTTKKSSSIKTTNPKWFSYKKIGKKSIKITGYKSEYGWNGIYQKKIKTLKFPSKINGYKVKSIEYCYPACYDNDYGKRLKKIIINKGCTSLGEGCFEGYKKLSSVELPSSMTNIGEDAFSECESLKSIKLPSGLKKIGEDAFSVSGIKSIKLPKKLKKLGSAAFRQTGLKSVTIPGGLKKTGDNQFAYCKKLKKATIKKDVK